MYREEKKRKGGVLFRRGDALGPEAEKKNTGENAKVRK